jgi:hypothetical protein
MNYIKQYAFSNSDKLDTITSFLESKENYILENYPYLGDFGTKLTEKQVSTRSGGYNVFNMVNECPELEDLLNFISTSYYDYIDNVMPNKTFDNTDINPAINCWLNVLRQTENIGMHRHANDYGDLWSFISGTFVLRATETNTNYKTKTDTVSVENQNGQLTIFPPYYWHWTDIHTFNETRLTLGMDFFFQKEHAKDDENFYNILVEL